jgi:hypothetical protein
LPAVIVVGAGFMTNSRSSLKFLELLLSKPLCKFWNLRFRMGISKVLSTFLLFSISLYFMDLTLLSFFKGKK